MTHDASIALIDNGKLVFSYEMEKLDNNARYSNFCISSQDIASILNGYGYTLDQIDRFVIDGWSGWRPNRLNADRERFTFEFKEGNDTSLIQFGQYGHIVSKEENMLIPESFETKLGTKPITYNSYHHVAGHVLSGYCTSPFAQNGEDSFVMVWDGAMPPQLFYYRFADRSLESLGFLFPLLGNIYSSFPAAFEPFKSKGYSHEDLSIAGKAMAYIALGESREEIIQFYETAFESVSQGVDPETVDIDTIAEVSQSFIELSQQYAEDYDVAHDDMLTSFHFFVQRLITRALHDKIANYPDYAKNLCWVGGCALNIKWNGAIRATGLFNDIWVPPFPNDAGSAIGTACCEMVTQSNVQSLEWDVYSGPAIVGEADFSEEYDSDFCSLKELARVLHEEDEPVVFLNGRAELGPRALGNRSILSAPTSPTMKERLNEVKKREHYRPVAPICIEEEASEVFDPGRKDPFMLYEHKVRPEWLDRVPAITHLDGTARLQTVNNTQNPEVYEVLQAYKELSGVPLLCNTSANYNGSGFFPDVRSVMEWGKVNFIWCNNRLYTRKSYKNKKFEAETMII